MDSRSSETKLFWEQFHRSPLVKAVAIVLIVVLTWVFVGKEFSLSRALADLNYDSAPAKAKKPTKPAEKLHAAVIELQELLAIQAKQNLTGKQVKSADAAKGEIASQLAALDRQFAADRVKLWKLKAKDALKRLDVIEVKTAKLKKQLNASLASLPSDGAKAKDAAGSVNKTLTALSPEKPQQPLSSDLSFGIKNAKPRSVSLSAGITPAYNSPTPNEAASLLPREPQPEDLEETPETRITPAIEQLATTLENDPVKIYEYVRNNIRYETYYGIRKGADQTLAEKAGSDADQAALLIALLRQSGYHSRFVQGVVELPAEKAANWLGVNTAAGERLNAVPEILWSGGIPTNTTRVAGKLTKVRFNHIWAESYLPQAAYRGVDEGSGEKSWSPLDASIKENEFTVPRVDAQRAVEPIVTDIARAFEEGSEVQNEHSVVLPTPDEVSQPLELRDRLKTAFEDNGVDDDTSVGEVLGGHRIRSENIGILPSTNPAKTVLVADEKRRLSDDMNSRVTISVTGSDPLAAPSSDEDDDEQTGFSYSARTHDLADKRITVGYAPATEDDAEIIDEYHGLLNGPSYASSLIPVLRVEGQVVARGRTPVSTGYSQQLEITYRMPGFVADRVANPLLVGSLSSLVLNLGSAYSKKLDTRARALSDASATWQQEEIITDRNLGEFMSMIGSLYFERNDYGNHFAARPLKVAKSRLLSGAVVATDVGASYVSGFPIATSFDGLYIDVDQDAQAVTKLDETSSIERYMQISGGGASTTEGLVFESIFEQPAVSTMKILNEAAVRGVPVSRATSANVDSVLAELPYSSDVESEIAEAVSRGAVVTIPAQSIQIGGWIGTGYVVDGGTALDYRVVGGTSGGVLGWLNDHDPTSLSNWARWTGNSEQLQNQAACVDAGLDAASIFALILGGSAYFSAVGINAMLAAYAEILLGVTLAGGPLAIFILVLAVVLLAIVTYLLYAVQDDSGDCGEGTSGVP